MNPSAIPSSINTPVASALPFNPGASSAGYVPYNQQGNNAIDAAQNGLTAPTPATAAPPQKGNWFSHLLPTIGSIAAPVIGGLLAPETGGLSLVAALALAGAGSAGGKAAEDAIQGQKINPVGLLESGAEGAAGQGIGMGAGSLIGSLGGKVADSLAQGATDRAAQATVADQTAQDLAEQTRIGNEFSAVKPGAASVGPAIAKANDLGITSPTAQDLKSIGSIYTGSNPETGTGVLNFYKNQALDQAGGTVDLNNTMDSLHTTLATPENQVLGGETPVTSSSGQLPKAPANVATKIVQQVRNMLPAPAVNAEGQIAENVSPQDAKTVLTSIGKQIDLTTPKPNALGITDPTDVAQNNVWKSVYQNVRSALYDRPEVDAAVQGLKVGPDESAVIDDAIKSNGITDPNVAANIKADLTSTLNNAQSGNDLLTAERPMVNVAKVGGIQTADEANNPQLARNVRAAQSQITPTATPTGGPSTADNLMGIGGIIGAPETHGLSLLGMIPTAAKLAKSPQTLDMADKLVNSGVSKKIAGLIPGALTGASQFITHAGDMTGAPVNLNLGDNNVNPSTPSLDPNSLNSLLLQLAVAESANPTTSGAGSSMVGQILPQIQNANVAQSSLTGAENAFQQAGGGQGGILGNLTRILGGITGNPASQYEAQRQQLINQLTPLGIPTSAVPQITGNNQSATNQFTALQQMINSRLNGGNISAIPAGVPAQ